MFEFALALIVFLAAHVLPRKTGLRDVLIAKLGRGPYIAGYAILSLALLAWLIAAAWRAPVIPLWSASPVTAALAVAAMLPACVLFLAGALRPNPLSVSFMGGETDPVRPGLLALTHHPILWAFLLWSGGHLLANGDLVAVILFGGFALFSLIGMRVFERRTRARLDPEVLARAAAISQGPLVERLRRALSWRTLLELAAALALYVALLHAHPVVIGVDPLALLR